MTAAQKIRKTILFFLFLLFPAYYNYLSPMLIVEGAWQGIAVASLLFWSFFFITSLFIGRAGCSYFCPLGAVQTIKHHAGGDQYKKVKYLSIAKYVLFIFWVVPIVLGIISAGGVYKIDLLYNSSILSVDSMEALIRFYIVLSLPLIFAYLFGKMGFCHYFCPFSVLNILGTRIKRILKIPSLHLSCNKSSCSDCKQCDRVCPMDIRVSEEVKNGRVENSSCILCGECSAACKSSVLKRKFGREA
ncbi:MAG: 4Fe-4S binding protein [Clostridia bacterium]|nr:4Fe-4S binding protein [Clostridia bacterium]